MLNDAPTAFFSYCHTDSDFALKLAEDLKAVGARVWIDQLDIDPGQEWDSAVERAVARSPRVLLILSPASVQSKHVRNEIAFALDEQKVIIPVLHQDCAVPLQLRRIQHIDFRTDYARGLGRLIKALVAEQQAAIATLDTATGALDPAVAGQLPASPRQPQTGRIAEPEPAVQTSGESTASSRKCPQCGRNNYDWAIRCGKCGYSFEAVEKAASSRNIVNRFVGRNESPETRAVPKPLAPALAPDPTPPLEMLRGELRSGHPIIPLVTKVFGTSDSLATPCFIIFHDLTENDLSALPLLIASLKKHKKYARQSFVLAYTKAPSPTVPGSQVDEITMVLRVPDRKVLEDLAIVTGGRACGRRHLGLQLENLTLEDCGFASQLQVLNSGVRIIGPAGEEPAIRGRASQLANAMRQQRTIGAREMARLRYEGLTGKPVADLPNYSPLVMPTDFDLQLEGGWASPYFVTDPENMAAELTDPFVVVSATPFLDISAREKPIVDFDRTISNVVIPDTVRVRRQPSNVSLPIEMLTRREVLVGGVLVLAPEFGNDALATMVVNKLLGRVRACAVEVKNFEAQDFETLAAKLKVVPFESSAADASPERFLGRCKNVMCYEDTCFIKF